MKMENLKAKCLHTGSYIVKAIYYHV